MRERQEACRRSTVFEGSTESPTVNLLHLLNTSSSLLPAGLANLFLPPVPTMREQSLLRPFFPVLQPVCPSPAIQSGGTQDQGPVGFPNSLSLNKVLKDRMPMWNGLDSFWLSFLYFSSGPLAHGDGSYFVLDGLVVKGIVPFE